MKYHLELGYLKFRITEPYLIYKYAKRLNMTYQQAKKCWMCGHDFEYLTPCPHCGITKALFDYGIIKGMSKKEREAWSIQEISK